MVEEAKFVGGLAGFQYFLKALANRRNPLPVRVGGMDLQIRPRTPDLTVARSASDGEFDAATAAADPLQYNFIIDAGGYIGTSSIVFAKRFPAATIVCLEPSVSNFNVLVRNTKPFANILPLNKALGARRGVARLQDSGLGEWGYTLLPVLTSGNTTPMHEVEITTIPEIMSKYGVRGADLVKLDIEGAEKEVLTDSAEWIGRVRVLMAELHDRLIPGCSDAWRIATRDKVQLVSSEHTVLCAG